MKKSMSIIALSAGLCMAAIPLMAEPKSNKQLVVEFYKQALIDQDVKAAAMAYLTEDYIQHNPRVPTGRDGFIKALSGWFSAVDVEFQIVRVIAEEDHVVLHVRQKVGDKTSAGVDIFRVEDGKIAEHWDVIQRVPDEMAHENGMF